MVPSLDASSGTPDRTRLLPGLGFAAAALLLAFSAVPGSVSRVGTPFAGFFYWDNGVLVGLHGDSWTGPIAGLPLNGGVLEAVEGQPFGRGGDLAQRLSRLPPGTPVAYRTALADEARDVVVPTMEMGGADFALTLGNYLFNGAALLVVGALALLLRPDLPAVRALAFATGALGALLILAVDYVTSYRMVFACRIVEGLAPAALMNLALVFPTARLRPRPRIAFVAALAAGVLALQIWGSVRFYDDPMLARTIAGWVYVLIALALLALLANYAETLLRAREPARRAQAAVVFAGALPAFALAATGMLAFTLLELSFSLAWVFVLLPLAPISMLYAMVRQDIFETERFVRLTIGYTLASSVILLAYAASLVLLEQMMMTEVATSPAAALVLILAVAISFDPLRRRVQWAIDRSFYRTRLDAGPELEETSEELATLGSESEIADYVGRRLRDILALEWVRILLDDPRPSGDAALQQGLSVRGELLGLIECGPKRSGAPYSSEERDFVRGVAAQTALAVHNARSLRALHEAQAELLRSARLAAVGEFAGAVAHGIRNPLSGIRASVQLAHTNIEEGESPSSAVATALTEADRLEQRIRSLLNFSRPYDSSLRETDVGELLESVAEAARAPAERSGVTVHVERPPEGIRREFDPNLMREVLLELATNALRAMPDGGELRLSLRRVGARLTLEVADTGEGIAPHLRERVFDLFFTTRLGGTGVGLATARRIVEGSGGSIEFDSHEGRGTTVRVHLG